MAYLVKRKKNDIIRSGLRWYWRYNHKRKHCGPTHKHTNTQTEHTESITRMRAQKKLAASKRTNTEATGERIQRMRHELRWCDVPSVRVRIRPETAPSQLWRRATSTRNHMEYGDSGFIFHIISYLSVIESADFFSLGWLCDELGATSAKCYTVFVRIRCWMHTAYLKMLDAHEQSTTTNRCGWQIERVAILVLDGTRMIPLNTVRICCLVESVLCIFREWFTDWLSDGVFNDTLEFEMRIDRR